VAAEVELPVKADKDAVRQSLRLVPYFVMRMISWLVERYHIRSQGQLPAVFTPYRTASLWKGTRFSNRRLKALGWSPVVRTEDGVRESLAWWKAQEASAA
jgi:nucleoside-diphosphate-sugar epimerase